MVGLGFVEGFDRIGSPTREMMSADGNKIAFPLAIRDPAGGIAGYIAAIYEEGVGISQVPIGKVRNSVWLSADGDVLVGSLDRDSSPDMPFRWTEERGVQELGLLAERISSPQAISPDASIITGVSDRDFIWDTESGLREHVIEGVEFGIVEISTGGSVMAGQATFDGESESQLFGWTEETGPVGLGNMLGEERMGPFHAMTDDGRLITAGFGTPYTPERNVGIWSDLRGLEDFQHAVVERHGLGEPLEGWDLQNVRAISPNGQFFAGAAINPDGNIEAFLIRLDRPFAAVPEPGSALLIALGAMPTLHFVRRSSRRRC